MILSRVVDGLCEKGIPAQRGYPVGRQRIITEPVCAVSLASAQSRSKEVRVRVQVLSPAELGGPACEETALEVGEILEQMDGKSTVGGIEFDGRAGVFSVEILADFFEERPKVFQNDTELTHAVAFTSWRMLDDEVTDWIDAKWNFRLEEYYPLDHDEELNPHGTFTLVHISEKGSETYLECTWTCQKREWDACGVRQIMLGQANLMDSG